MILEQTTKNKNFANCRATNKVTGEVKFFTVSQNSDRAKVATMLGTDWIVTRY